MKVNTILIPGVNDEHVEEVARVMADLGTDILNCVPLYPVADTPFDFREAHAIGERIDQNDSQLRNGGGYDHNFALRRRTRAELELAATVAEPTTGARFGLRDATATMGWRFWGLRARICATLELRAIAEGRSRCSSPIRISGRCSMEARTPERAP